MQEYINSLSQNLNLSNYQTNRLKKDYDLYNISRIQKRGGVLYVPYLSHGFWGRVGRVLFGARADLIGHDKILLRAQRNIKFCANGYHCVRVGKYTYYANSYGQVISRDEFLRETGC
ncbi:MAG: hypothetical protein IJY99_00190 [Alphaproteobacteria bacterium]|nr:hypothetical protein [Alphaproteobacteria bacterium]